MEAESAKGEASYSASGVVASEDARGDETFGFVCAGLAVVEESGDTGNLPLGFGFPPTVRRVGLP